MTKGKHTPEETYPEEDRRFVVLANANDAYRQIWKRLRKTIKQRDDLADALEGLLEKDFGKAGYCAHCEADHNDVFGSEKGGCPWAAARAALKKAGR